MNPAMAGSPVSVVDEAAALRTPCSGFLKSLSQSVKIVSLYRISHPAAVMAIGESFKAFEGILEEGGLDRLTLTMADERWLFNGTAAAPAAAAHAGGGLKDLFLRHGVTSLTFLHGTGLYEFSALCDLFKEAPTPAEETRLPELLLQRGIRHILVNTVVYSAQRRAASPAPEPKPAPRPERVASSTQAPAFGALLRNLVETVLSTVAAGKVVVDKEGNVLMMNPVAEQITGKRLAEVAGRHINEAIDTKDQMVTLSADLDIRDDQSLTRQIRVLATREVERALKQSGPAH